MASSKELKGRINSIEAIKQVSLAMKSVSIIKYERMKDVIPVEKAIESSITNIAATVISSIEGNNRFIADTSKGDAKNIGVVLIGSNKGLAGGYNISVLQNFVSLMKETKADKYFVYPVGKKLLTPLSQLKNVEIVKDDFIIDENLVKPVMSNVADLVINDFLDEKFDEIYIINQESENVVSTKTNIKKVLPINLEELNEGAEITATTIKPDAVSVLTEVIPLYFKLKLQSSAVNALFAEHQSRRQTMETAVDNADENLSKLKLQVNRERQASITQEVSEIASNVALKKQKGAQ